MRIGRKLLGSEAAGRNRAVKGSCGQGVRAHACAWAHRDAQHPHDTRSMKPLAGLTPPEEKCAQSHVGKAATRLQAQPLKRCCGGYSLSTCVEAADVK